MFTDLLNSIWTELDLDPPTFVSDLPLLNFLDSLDPTYLSTSIPNQLLYYLLDFLRSHQSKNMLCPNTNNIIASIIASLNQVK